MMTRPPGFSTRSASRKKATGNSMWCSTSTIKAFNYLLTLQDNVAPADIHTDGATSEQDKQIIENYFKRSQDKGGAQ
jgi:hypothetical protein